MAPRSGGRFRLTIRARITLSVALLIALGGGIIVTGLNLFMRFGPVWALPAITSSAVPPGELVAADIDLSEVVMDDAGGLSGLQATVPALEIRDASDVLGTLLWSSIIALVVIVVLGSLAAWLLAGRVLAPLHEINAAARAATPNQLDRRVGLRGPRDELTDLSDTLDAMLERLEHAFRAQQLFAANASHELRTPLATEKALLDMLLDGPEPTLAEYRKVAEQLREVNGRSIAMGEALLDLTRAQLGPGGVAQLDLAPAAVTEILAEPLARANEDAAERGTPIRLDVSAHALAAKPELLGRLVDNLLGNAIRHGIAGEEIGLSWRPEGDESVLVVRNSATRLDLETRARLHEPFVRGGGRVRADGGSGLGLAIAAAVAQAHGGTLRVRDPAWLGPGAPGPEITAEEFIVEVRLPLRARIDTLAP